MFWILSMLAGVMIGIGEPGPAVVFFLAMAAWPCPRGDEDTEETR